MRQLLNRLVRRVPPPLVVILLLQLYDLVHSPTSLALWIMAWHQLGFTIMLGIGPTYPGPPGVLRLFYWVFREAIFWPGLIYRFLKGQIQ